MFLWAWNTERIGKLEIRKNNYFKTETDEII